jgi:hypothetical protein
MTSVVSAAAVNAPRRRWPSAGLSLAGAVTFLYAGFLPMVNSPKVCCPGLIGILGFESRILIDSMALMIPVIGLAAPGLLFSMTWARVVRGLLLSTGLIGAALIAQAAGGLIAVKGGAPAAGAILGWTGSSLIFAASLLLLEPATNSGSRELGRSLKFAVPVGILLGVGMFLVAVLLPWSIRPFPLKLIALPHESQYWIWSTVLETAIILPTTIAGVRLLRKDSPHRSDLGVALGGGVFATLVFVQIVGQVLVSSQLGGPRFSLTWSAYLGLGAGGLIIASALVGVWSVARR